MNNSKEEQLKRKTPTIYTDPKSTSTLQHLFGHLAIWKMEIGNKITDYYFDADALKTKAYYTKRTKGNTKLSDTFNFDEVRAKEVVFRKNFDIRAIEEGWDEKRKGIEKVAFEHRSDILDGATYGSWIGISDGVSFPGHGKRYWERGTGASVWDEGIAEFVWLKACSPQTIIDLKEYLSPQHFQILDEMSDYLINGGKFND